MAILVNLRHQAGRNLSYKPVPPYYTGPLDDIIILAHSAIFNGVTPHVLNDGMCTHRAMRVENNGHTGI